MQGYYDRDAFSNRQSCPVTGKLCLTRTNAAFRKHNRVLDKGKDIPIPTVYRPVGCWTQHAIVHAG